MKLHNPLFLFFLLLLPLLPASCGRHGASRPSVASLDGELEYSRLLSLSERADGCFEVDIRNPWDTTRILQSLLLVSDSVAEPENPEGRGVVRIPLGNALVYSSVHTGLICELGADSAIGGVCDASYISQPVLKARLAEGSITDCGNSSSPVIEKIISLRPDAILLSPYENSLDHSSLARLGTTVIECADYMEPTPLGRAEWMKFYGLLFGRRAEAEVLWRDTRDAYSRLSGVAVGMSSRPKVLLDRLYSGVWYLPGPSSLWDIYLRDAGAVNPFGHMASGSTLSLSAEQVLAGASDADLWLIRYNAADSLTLDRLSGENPLYSRIAAFRDGKVFGTNTAVTPIFEDIPFHPQWLLGELVEIIHPELADSLPQRPIHYFHPMK